MTTRNNDPTQFGVSQHLKTKQDAIFLLWEKKVLEHIPAARSLSKTQLRNKLPLFLERLAETLSPSVLQPISFEQVNEISQDHGQQRATLTGYSLHQIIREYQFFREAIFEILETSSPVTKRERDIILSAIEQAMAEAGTYYDRIIRKEDLSQRKIVEDALKREQEFLNAILNQIPVSVWILEGGTGKILIENPLAKNFMQQPERPVQSYKDYSGYTAYHRDGKPYGPMDYPGSRALLNGETIVNEEMIIIKQDGSRGYAEFSAGPIRDSNGQIYAAVAVALDVTGKKLAEETIQSTLKQLQAFFNQSPTPMVISEGPNHLFTFANQPYEKMLGRKITGKTASEAFTEEEVRHFIPILDGVYKTGNPFVGREQLLKTTKENGKIEERWFNVNYFPHFDESGSVKGIILEVHEVTDQVKEKKVIQESEERFRLISNALPLIFWTARPDGYVDWYNDWWYEYLNQPRGTEWNDSEKSPMHPDDIPKTLKVWNECLETGGPYEIEQRFKRGSDGKYRWHLVRGVPIKGDGGKIIKWVGANVDIHDHKELVQKLEEEKILRERFVAALSHDLRTPLTSAKLTAQVTRRSYLHDEKLTRSSDRIISNLDRVDNMIQDLLDASRLSAGERLPIKIEEVDLSALIHSTIDDLRQIHGNRFNVVEKSASTVCHLDSGGLRRILENLCANAIKYGDPLQSITVKIDCNSTKEAEISVHNHGSPISEEDQKNLFRPYMRSESALVSDKIGWGIGLMLVKGIVLAHGGEVFVKSNQETGTTFYVRLPVNCARE